VIKGIIYVILATIGWGLVGTFIYLLPQIDSATLAFSRVVFGLLGIVFFAFIFKRQKNLFGELKKETILQGLAFTGATLFFIISVRLSTVANAVFLQYSAPIFIIVLSKIFLKERIEKKTLGSLALSFLGILIIFNGNLNSNFTLGNIFGLLSGICYSIQVVVGKKLGDYYMGYKTAFWQCLIAIPILLPMTNFSQILNLSINNLLLLISFGLVCTGMAESLFLQGLKIMRAQDASIFIVLDAIFNPLFVFIFFWIKPPIEILIGGALIIGAILIQSKRIKEKANSNIVLREPNQIRKPL
jgi:drug/metabolite transporter (DMT)-like permease